MWLERCFSPPNGDALLVIHYHYQVVMELSKKDALMCVCIRVSVPVRYLDLKTRRDAILIQY